MWWSVMAETLLEIDGIETCYGLSQVLFGLSLKVQSGEMVALMGRNGMGKTTTIRSIMGMTPARAGKVRFAGEEVRSLPSYKIAKLGIGLVPEGRQIFPNLTVYENLVAASGNRMGNPDPWTIDKIHALFPRLAERSSNMGVTLSGGEQQMLAIGRALMTNPKLLILDEATEGLAPLIREEIWNCLSLLKSKGQSVLVIDKNVRNLTRSPTATTSSSVAARSGATSDELIRRRAAAPVSGDLDIPSPEIRFPSASVLYLPLTGIADVTVDR
jgi:branched-chain amino acid transport system ATP-binding protein